MLLLLLKASVSIDRHLSAEVSPAPFLRRHHFAKPLRLFQFMKAKLMNIIPLKCYSILPLSKLELLLLEQLCRAVSGRLEGTLQALPPPYRLNKPLLETTSSNTERLASKTPNHAVVWSAGNPLFPP